MLNLNEQLRCFGNVLKTISRNARGVNVDPEARALPQLIPPGAVCFDIGASYGRYTLRMSRIAGAAGQIHCFEPAGQSFQVLRMITKFYHLRNVILVKKALSREAGVGTLALPIKKHFVIGPAAGYCLAHLTTDSDDNCLTDSVAITTIDDYAAEVDLSRLDFIKCDVEGAELLVFEGGGKTIERFKPVILCEIYETWLKRFGTTPAELQSFFTKRGYKTFAFQDHTFCEIHSITKGGNYFFMSYPSLRTASG